MQLDELDSLGGICTFSRPRQLYFAADTLSWGGRAEATRAERLALEGDLTTLAHLKIDEWQWLTDAAGLGTSPRI